MITDILDRELKVDDYVVFYNNIYQVKGLSRGNTKNHKGYAKIMLIDPSKTTKPVNKYSGDMCKIDAGDVMFWMLKK